MQSTYLLSLIKITFQSVFHSEVIFLVLLVQNSFIFGPMRCRLPNTCDLTLAPVFDLQMELNSGEIGGVYLNMQLSTAKCVSAGSWR
jgi:hypothetical protein